MSSELLLRAQSINKDYLLSSSPLHRLGEALFGGMVDREQIQVLENINLEVFRGETVGIMGRNGVGKTTLLSILAGTIEATSGSVSRFGKISAILGVGGNFVQDLSGRENASNFCDVMGLGRRAKEEAVVRIQQFSDLGAFFDRPVRTYSSGMNSRLGFACAINVQADLIIIDETLSVGDADFRMKCYNYMEVRQKQGQTYLLVSHSPGVIANICTRSIVLEKGNIVFNGEPAGAVSSYREIVDKIRTRRKVRLDIIDDMEAWIALDAASFHEEARDESLELVNAHFCEQSLTAGECFSEIHCTIRAKAEVLEPRMQMAIRNNKGIVIATYRSEHDKIHIHPLEEGDTFTIVVVFNNILISGRYWIRIALSQNMDQGPELIKVYDRAISFEWAGRKRGGLVDLDMHSIEAAQTASNAPPSAKDQDLKL